MINIERNIIVEMAKRDVEKLLEDDQYVIEVATELRRKLGLEVPEEYQ